MSVKTEIMAEKTKNGTYTATGDASNLKEIVKNDLVKSGSGFEVSEPETSGNNKLIKIKYTNAALKKDAISTGVPAETGHVNYIITLAGKDATLTSNVPDSQFGTFTADTSTGGGSSAEPGTGGGSNVEPGTGGITGVNFGEKTASTVEQGDTITIGTEQFMVLKRTSTKIMAMPYYNITLSTTNPEQSSSAGTTSFASEYYWFNATGDGDDIDMTNAANNIQQYITAYSNKLSGLTENKVTAEVGRNYGEDAISAFVNQSNSESKMLLNPSGTGSFWIGTCYNYYSPGPALTTIISEGVTGDYYSEVVSYNELCGVRPVVYISLT